MITIGGGTIATCVITVLTNGLTSFFLMIFLISGIIFLTALICLIASTLETGNEFTSVLMIAFLIGLYFGVVPVLGDNNLVLFFDNVESTENTELLIDLTDDALDEASDLIDDKRDLIEGTERLTFLMALRTTGDDLTFLIALRTTGDEAVDLIEDTPDLIDEATERLTFLIALRTTGDPFLTTRLMFLNTGDPERLTSFIALR